MTRGLKLLCRFNLLKAEGVLIWNSPELMSPFSTADSVPLRGLELSLLHGTMKKKKKKKRDRQMCKGQHPSPCRASKHHLFLCFFLGKIYSFQEKDIIKSNKNKLVLDWLENNRRRLPYKKYTEPIMKVVFSLLSNYILSQSNVPFPCAYLLLYMDSPVRPGFDSCSRAPVSPLLLGEEEAARPFSRWWKPILGLPSKLPSSWIRQRQQLLILQMLTGTCV